MGLLEKFRKSRFGAQTENQPTTPPYQQTVLQEYAVRFRSTLDSAQFDSFTRIEQPGTFGTRPIPVVAADYLVTENSNYLMTENNDNLII